MNGCSVLGSTTPAITGTKGINQTPVRTNVGVIELTLDTPMAPEEYSVGGGISEPMNNVSFIPTKILDSGVAKIEIRTYAEGVPADLDFDVIVFRFIDINS